MIDKQKNNAFNFYLFYFVIQQVYLVAIYLDKYVNIKYHQYVAYLNIFLIIIFLYNYQLYFFL